MQYPSMPGIRCVPSSSSRRCRRRRSAPRWAAGASRSSTLWAGASSRRSSTAPSPPSCSRTRSSPRGALRSSRACCYGSWRPRASHCAHGGRGVLMWTAQHGPRRSSPAAWPRGTGTRRPGPCHAPRRGARTAQSPRPSLGRLAAAAPPPRRLDPPTLPCSLLLQAAAAGQGGGRQEGQTRQWAAR